MKLTLLLLALQVTSTNAILCWIFGLFAGGSSGGIQAILNNQVAGKPQETGTPTGVGFDRFVIENFERPSFDGCFFSFTADFKFYNSATGTGDSVSEDGMATMEGTFDIFNFLFSFFQVCIDGLEVTEVEFESDSSDQLEEFARQSINSQFDDPECFEEED